MALGRERLDVYRLAITCVAWVYEKAATLEGVHRAARDQWLRASQSIPIPIAIAIWMRPSPNKALHQPPLARRLLRADDRLLAHICHNPGHQPITPKLLLAGRAARLAEKYWKNIGPATH